ncbi:hypothetical protein [Anaerosporobacter sp.]
MIKKINVRNKVDNIEKQIGLFLLEVLYEQGEINRETYRLSVNDWNKEERREVA